MTGKQIFYLIGNCLTVDDNQQKKGIIVQTFRKADMDWQKFTSIANQHLVIPTIYLKLLNNSLLPELPIKLAEHLQHIYQFNYERNLAVLKQIKEINNLLCAKNIHPIYLKGTGNLLDGLYSDIGERIFGDIDFLVSEDDFVTSAKILIENGYKHYDDYDPDSKIRYKHFPRMYKQDVPADVEVHQRPVNIGIKYFNFEMINTKKRSALLCPECYVMSDEQKLIMNFLHGYKEPDVCSHISYRNMYDFYLLSRRIDVLKVLQDFGHYRLKSTVYANFSFNALNESKPQGRIFFTRLFKSLYHLQMNYKLIYRIVRLISFNSFLFVYRIETLSSSKTRLPAIKSYTRRVFLKPLYKTFKRLAL